MPKRKYLAQKMMGQQLKDYIRHRLRTIHLHGVHSPFVYQLYCQVIADDRYYYAFDYIEDIRRHLQKNDQSITVSDFGTGSKYGNQVNRKISQVVKSASSPKQGRFLFRLVHFLRPQVILELGSNLGIGTLYMAEACSSQTRIFTYEGCPNIAHLSQRLHQNSHTEIQSITGNLDETLLTQFTKIQRVDLVYFDANHKLKPTMYYFELCLEKAHENTCFVFDDIYHSSEMKRAWQCIRENPSVRLSIDLFDLGIVFFSTRQPKQHFHLKF